MSDDNFKKFIESTNELKEKSEDEINETDKKILEELNKKNKPEEEELNFKHHKKEVLVGVGVIAVAIIIGITVFVTIILPMYGIESVDLDLPEIITEEGEVRYVPDTNYKPTTPEEGNSFIVESDGTFQARYYDNSNVPTMVFLSPENYSDIFFDCYEDNEGVKHFFGVFQLVEGTRLQVDMNIVGAYPSSSQTIGQGQSLTYEGICP